MDTQQQQHRFSSSSSSTFPPSRRTSRASSTSSSYFDVSEEPQILRVRSCDGKILTIDLADLEAHSGAFHGARSFAFSPLQLPVDIGENGDPNDDKTKDLKALELPEQGAVLDLLFKHMRREPFPDLRSVPFELLAGLAEAAEKYEAFAAMAICEIHMRNSIASHPFEVLEYAARHRHLDIANEAAKRTLGRSYKTATRLLSPGVALAWFCYNAEWKSCFDVGAALPSICLHDKDKEAIVSRGCEDWQNALALILQALLKVPTSIEQVEEIFSQALEMLECGGTGIAALRATRRVLLQKMNALPPFSTFL